MTKPKTPKPTGRKPTKAHKITPPDMPKHRSDKKAAGQSGVDESSLAKFGVGFGKATPKRDDLADPTMPMIACGNCESETQAIGNWCDCPVCGVPLREFPVRSLAEWNKWADPKNQSAEAIDMRAKMGIPVASGVAPVQTAPPAIVLGAKPATTAPTDQGDGESADPADPIK